MARASVKGRNQASSAHLGLLAQNSRGPFFSISAIAVGISYQLSGRETQAPENSAGSVPGSNSDHGKHVAAAKICTRCMIPNLYFWCLISRVNATRPADGHRWELVGACADPLAGWHETASQATSSVDGTQTPDFELRTITCVQGLWTSAWKHSQQVRRFSCPVMGDPSQQVHAAKGAWQLSSTFSRVVRFRAYANFKVAPSWARRGEPCSHLGPS